MTKEYIHIVWCRMTAILVVGLFAVAASAQQFSVKSFRLLPNDISAYVSPVKDLNNEACALIKVVGNRDFVFSSPLGIVKRKDETGEIWIYVPHGTVQITIKHPHWGVLRDYQFPSPLETRLTYELVLRQPSLVKNDVESPLVDRPAFLDTTLRYNKPPVIKKARIRQPLQTIVMANVGFHAGHPSFGLMVSFIRRHGIYLHAQTDLHSNSSTIGECDKDGAVEGSTPYYTNQTKDARSLFFVGGMHRLTKTFLLYEGVGYGKRNLVWQKSDGSYLLNTGYSYKGLAGEVGAAFAIRRYLLSAGVMTIKGSYWEPNIAIGYQF
jgi:hypothetical protein